MVLSRNPLSLKNAAIADSWFKACYHIGLFFIPLSIFGVVTKFGVLYASDIIFVLIAHPALIQIFQRQSFYGPIAISLMIISTISFIVFPFVYSVDLLLRIAKITIGVLIFKTLIPRYGLNALVASISVCLIYLGYQKVALAFGFNAPFLTSGEFPFSLEPGTQLNHYTGLFKLGTNYALIESIDLSFLGYKSAVFAREMSHNMVFFVPFLICMLYNKFCFISEQKLRLYVLGACFIIVLFGLGRTAMFSAITAISMLALIRFFPSIKSYERAVFGIAATLFFIAVLIYSYQFSAFVEQNSLGSKFTPVAQWFHQPTEIMLLGSGYNAPVFFPQLGWRNDINSSIGSVLLFNGAIGIVAYLVIVWRIILTGKYPASAYALVVTLYNYEWLTVLPPLYLLIGIYFADTQQPESLKGFHSDNE